MIREGDATQAPIAYDKCAGDCGVPNCPHDAGHVERAKKSAVALGCCAACGRYMGLQAVPGRAGAEYCSTGCQLNVEGNEDVGPEMAVSIRDAQCMRIGELQRKLADAKQQIFELKNELSAANRARAQVIVQWAKDIERAGMD